LTLFKWYVIWECSQIDIWYHGIDIVSKPLVFKNEYNNEQFVHRVGKENQYKANFRHWLITWKLTGVLMDTCGISSSIDTTLGFNNITVLLPIPQWHRTMHYWIKYMCAYYPESTAQSRVRRLYSWLCNNICATTLKALGIFRVGPLSCKPYFASIYPSKSISKQMALRSKQVFQVKRKKGIKKSVVVDLNARKSSNFYHVKLDDFLVVSVQS